VNPSGAPDRPAAEQPDPAQLRRTYGDHGISEGELAADPFSQFSAWLCEAVALATVGPSGQPSARTVLLKAVDQRGFTFFTNLGSRKAQELSTQPNASLVFPWYDIERQVVVIGSVVPVVGTEVEEYFATRPRASQLGAWASRQSTLLGGRADLEHAYAEAAARWPSGVPVPAPPFWGGFRVAAVTVEFWQGRPNRLHDRLRYRRDTQQPSGWVLERLSP
jgi:pyridoxamine 5'-phosphate oxidase